MAKNEKTLWELEPHTRGKHLVLRAYLNAWLPIMSAYNTRVLFIDGFAGPGEYANGEEGSPQIAIRALVDHSAEISADVAYFFIEKDEKRSEHLGKIVDRWKPKVPRKTSLNVISGKFDDTMRDIFAYLEEKNSKMAP